MPGTRVHISRKAVAALKRGDWINDNVVPGFKARRPNRHVLYGMNMRIAGRMRWITIGSEIEWTPDQARSEAERIRGLKRQNVDVAAERDRRKATLTLAAATDRFLKEHVALKLRPRTAKHYEEMMHRLVLPSLGKHRLDSIAPADVAGWHSSLASTPTQANRALAILSSLMGWAGRLRLMTGQPCVGLTPYREQPVNRYPTHTEIARIARTMDELVAECALNPVFAAGVKVVMMTGARRSEIFEAEWPWLDAERRCLTLPDSKTGAKVIALPAVALDLILGQPRLAGCRWIFPSTKTNRPFVNFTAQWKPVLERAGVGPWRLHDMRHGFASAAIAAGASLYIVGKQLGHAKAATTGRYAHISDEPKHALAEMVAALFAIGEK